MRGGVHQCRADHLAVHGPVPSHQIGGELDSGALHRMSVPSEPVP